MRPRKGGRRVIRPAENFGTLGHLDSLIYLPDLATHVYGERAKWPDSSLTAFAYCYRRFGPPPMGTDDYKNLGGGWILTTGDPEVFFAVDPGGCSIDLYLHHYVAERLRDEADAPARGWRQESRRRFDVAHPRKTLEDYLLAQMQGGPCRWLEDMPPYPRRCSAEIEARVEGTVTYVLRDLLRPCYVRDVAINLFGRISTKNPARGQEAKRSPLSGWGVPVREIERQMAREGEDMVERGP